ncbi:MAG: CBS domain-containing protein [Planctomycetaceae bacterium]|nr:CBS domain-containing protein [Planctomycetaceae bacterium]
MDTLAEILQRKIDSPLHTVDEGCTALEAVHLMNEHSIGALIVTREGQMTGIFTERDVLRRVVGADQNPAAVRVADVMTTRVVCCTPATTIEDARTMMKDRRVRHLPVLDAEGQVAGLISIGDLNAHLASNQEVQIHYLQEYLHGRV